MLELGGNDPIIVMEDADLDEAATLAAAGSYKNSGQRCTAVKRMLVHERVADAFVERLVAKTQAWTYGDPADPSVDMGTVIDEAAARSFERRSTRPSRRARALLFGNERDGALYSPTVLDHVTPDMDVVRTETFGPVSPVIRFKDIDEAIRISNGTAYGLSSAVCTNRLDYITRFVSELQVGTVNVREVPGLPARADAVRRHQGLGPRLQGRRAGSDEELHQRQDVLAAMVIRRTKVQPYFCPVSMT